jgi:hypothetical protein
MMQSVKERRTTELILDDGCTLFELRELNCIFLTVYGEIHVLQEDSPC